MTSEIYFILKNYTQSNEHIKIDFILNSNEENILIRYDNQTEKIYVLNDCLLIESDDENKIDCTVIPIESIFYIDIKSVEKPKQYFGDDNER